MSGGFFDWDGGAMSRLGELLHEFVDQHQSGDFDESQEMRYSQSALDRFIDIADLLYRCQEITNAVDRFVSGDDCEQYFFANLARIRCGIELLDKIKSSVKI